MDSIFQTQLPYDIEQSKSLPGTSPLNPEEWLMKDEAYAGQMSERERLISTHRDDVIAMDDVAKASAGELLEKTIDFLPRLGGFIREQDRIICPDGRVVMLETSDPMATLGRLVQNDFCILHQQGDEHILSAAVLCFPASWSLGEKFMRPLSVIHEPVEEYDENITKRVQRMFNGIKVDRPLWRFNTLNYEHPQLFHPRTHTTRRDPQPFNGGKYLRSERQTLTRLPKTGAVIFSIHTFILDKNETP